MQKAAVHPEGRPFARPFESTLARPGGPPVAGGAPFGPAAALIAVLAVLLIFVLPLYVPLRPVQTVSVSYLTGFNNSVAVFASVGLGVAVLLWMLWTHRYTLTPAVPLAERRLTPGFVAVVVLLSSVVLAVSGYLVATSQVRYLGDAGYIIEQATVHRETGLALYTHIEFAYGPLLALPEGWLSGLLHISVTAAYFVILVLESALGLLLLAYVLNELPIRDDLRRPALVLLAVGALTPHLGLNYTYFRFISGVALLLYATHTRSLWRCVLLLSLGEILELLISPELGLAMAAGVLVYGVLRAWQSGWRWLLAAVVPLLVLATLLLTLGRPFLRMAASFSRGALNLPVGPYPHILVLLVALLWLVPLGLARRVQWREPESARLLAAYAVGIAFLPATLGRCDPLHVLFNGATLLVLSLLGVSQSSRPWRLAWLGALAVLVLWSQFVNQRFFQFRTAYVLRQAVLADLPHSLRAALVRPLQGHNPSLARLLAEDREPEYAWDPAMFAGLTHGGAVATPVEISPVVEAELKATHQYAPEYYGFWVNMMNPEAEQHSIAEANRCPFMLLPANLQAKNVHTPDSLATLQGMRLPYHERNSMSYLPASLFLANLHERWEPVARLGPYMLYRQRGVGGGA